MRAEDSDEAEALVEDEYRKVNVFLEFEHDYSARKYYKTFKNNSVHLCVETKIGSLTAKGNTVDECWRRFFFEHSSICYNDIIDYDYY